MKHSVAAQYFSAKKFTHKSREDNCYIKPRAQIRPIQNTRLQPKQGFVPSKITLLCIDFLGNMVLLSKGPTL